jgi:copper chaperone CopZ
MDRRILNSVEISGYLGAALFSFFLISGCKNPADNATNSGQPVRTGAAAMEKTMATSQVTSISSTVIKVEGMTCASCVGQIKRGMRSTPGIKELEIDLQNREARVQFDPAQVSPELIAIAIEKLGYKATVAFPGSFK